MEEEISGDDNVQRVFALADLRRDILAQRLDEAWKLYTKYGVVHGNVPNVPGQISNSYPEALAAYFPEEYRIDARNCPEGYAVQKELQQDMDALERIVRGEYQFNRSERLYNRDYTIPTDTGAIDVAHLALAGILTKSAYDALQQKEFRAQLKDSYGVDPLRVAFGFGMRLIERHFDEESFVLFGKYQAEKGKRKDQLCSIPGAVAAEMLRDASCAILLTEAMEHLTSHYNVAASTIQFSIRKFVENPKEWIREDDPRYDCAFSFPRLFNSDTYGAISLESVHAMMNVFRRDYRLATTHDDAEKIGDVLGTHRRKIVDYTMAGELAFRSVSLLPTESGRKTHLFCGYDLKEREAAQNPTDMYRAFCQRNELDPREIRNYRVYKREFSQTMGEIAEIIEQAKQSRTQKSVSETIDSIVLFVPLSEREVIRGSSPEDYYSRDLAKYRSLKEEERRALAAITHGDALLSKFIPEDDPHGICAVVEGFLQERICADPKGALAKEYQQYQRSMSIVSDGEESQKRIRAYVLRHFMFKYNFMPNYLCLLREHLEERRERSREKDEYAVPGFVAVYDALMIAQGKQRKRKKAHVWSGPLRFSEELGMVVALCKEEIARVYKDYSVVAERAKDLMYHGSLRLVPDFAERYKHDDLTSLDKIQEGNLGLRRAVKMYDYRMERFSTCAFFWIRQAIVRACKNTGPVRIPTHVYETVSLVTKVQRERQQRGQDASREQAINTIIRDQLRPNLKVHAALRRHHAAKKIMHIDAPVHDDNETSYHERVADQNQNRSEAYHEIETRDHVAVLLATLSPMEQKIMRMRFGIGMEREYTQREVSRSVHISENQVRQTEKQLLERLRGLQTREEDMLLIGK